MQNRHNSSERVKIMVIPWFTLQIHQEEGEPWVDLQLSPGSHQLGLSVLKSQANLTLHTLTNITKVEVADAPFLQTLKGMMGQRG